MLFFTVIVSALIWITQATPSGNHTCTGVIKHPVTVRVNVTEPVTYRTYTWCLRVPPRCSKYTIQLQDRVKIHTEMHNRTITVCCKGYMEMNYKCVPACPPQADCPFMHCNRTNHCYCTPGYTGLYCNDPCERGFWGEHCLKECDCPSGYTCHHLTGDCMLDDKRPSSKTRRTTTTTTTTSTQLTSTKSTLTTSVKPETVTITDTPVATTPTTTTTSPSTTILSTTTPSTTAPTTTTTIKSTPTFPTITPPFTLSTTSHRPTTPRSTQETDPTTEASTLRPTISRTESEPSTKKSTTVTPPSVQSSDPDRSTEAATKSSTVTSTVAMTPTIRAIQLSYTDVSTIISSLSNVTSPGKTISTIRFTPFQNTADLTTAEMTSASVPVSQATSTTTSTLVTTPGAIISTFQTTPPTTSGEIHGPITQKAETTDPSLKEPDLPEPKGTDTLSTQNENVMNTTSSRVYIVTSVATPIKVETTTHTPSTELKTIEAVTREVTQSKPTTERVLYENLPPLMVNRKKPNQSPEIKVSGTYTTPDQKETLDRHSLTTSLPPTKQTLSRTNINVGAPVVPFPHQPVTKQVPKVMNPIPIDHLNKTEATSPSSTPSTSSTPGVLQFSSTTMNKSPLDFLQLRRSQKPFDIANSDNSITAHPPFVPKEPTTEHAPLVPFLDTNKRLWEIFETGLNVKTTNAAVRTLQPTRATTTATPTKAPFIKAFEQYGDLEMPIKKSDTLHTTRAPVEPVYIKTTLPLFEFEKDSSAESSHMQKQPKHKEKYQKKHKSKVYDVPSTSATHQQPTTDAFPTTENKPSNKSSNTFYNTESMLELSKATPGKGNQPQATTEYVPNPTSARPSHTWYSHAREKAKIKEAMKSLRTTSLLDNLARPTAAFDNDSNDINLMQTSFTEGSKIYKESEDDKIKEQYLKINSINITRKESVYMPSRITASNVGSFSFYSNMFLINTLCVIMLITFIVLLWLHLSRKKRKPEDSRGSIMAYASQSETVSPLIYETVFPLNGGPESLEASTFFCPTFTNHYADRINREFSELHYDHPRPSKPCEQSVTYSNVQFNNS